MHRAIQAVIALCIMAVLVGFLARGTDWAEVSAAIMQARPAWLGAALVAIIACFFTRIQRWSYIVRAVHPASFRHMFSATQIGFLVNFTIALRLGELVRAVALARLARLPVSKSLALVAMDRVTDLVGLLAVMLVAVTAYRPTADVVIPPNTLGNAAEVIVPKALIQVCTLGTFAGLVGIVVVLVAVYVSQDLALRWIRATLGRVSARLSEWVCRMLAQFADGLHIFRSAGDLAKSTVFSLITWGLFVAALWCFIQAFSIEAPWYAAFVAQSMLAVAVGLPGVPGMLGQFHLPIVAGLVMATPGLDPNQAKALAIAAYLFNAGPVILTGLACAMWEGMGVVDMTRAGVAAEAHAKSPGDL